MHLLQVLDKDSGWKRRKEKSPASIRTHAPSIARHALYLSAATLPIDFEVDGNLS